MTSISTNQSFRKGFTFLAGTAGAVVGAVVCVIAAVAGAHFANLSLGPWVGISAGIGSLAGATAMYITYPKIPND